MDLTTLDTSTASEEGAELHLLHPATFTPLYTDDKPIAITLAGADSERYRKAQRAAINGRLKQGVRIKVTAEQIEADTTETLARCTLSWSGIVMDGAELPCTLENARKLYQRLEWVKEQADQFVGDRANFLRASPKT